MACAGDSDRVRLGSGRPHLVVLGGGNMSDEPLSETAQGVAAYAVMEAVLIELVSQGVLTNQRLDEVLTKAAAAFDPHPGIPTGEKDSQIAAAIRLLKSDICEQK